MLDDPLDRAEDPRARRESCELNRKVTDVLAAMGEGGFDAVFLAVGAQLARRTYIPAGSASHMLDDSHAA